MNIVILKIVNNMNHFFPSRVISRIHQKHIRWTCLVAFPGPVVAVRSISCNGRGWHTHTHTYIYIYVYIYMCSVNDFCWLKYLSRYRRLQIFRINILRTKSTHKPIAQWVRHVQIIQHQFRMISSLEIFGRWIPLFFLVGGLEHFLFSILGIIIPTDELIFFQRGSNHQPVLIVTYFWPVTVVTVLAITMKLVLQRVTRASVRVDGQEISSIGQGAWWDGNWVPSIG